jgi:MFS family permease
VYGSTLACNLGLKKVENRVQTLPQSDDTIQRLESTVLVIRSLASSDDYIDGPSLMTTGMTYHTVVRLRCPRAMASQPFIPSVFLSSRRRYLSILWCFLTFIVSCWPPFHPTVPSTLRSFCFFRASFEEMAISVSDTSLASAIHAGPWWRHRGVLRLNFYLFIPLLTGCINGYNSCLVNGLQILPAWRQQFLNPHGKTLGMITSAQIIGSLVGLPLAPLCSDRFGRRATLVVGAILMLGGVALQAIASTVGVFIAARLLAGAGLIFGTIAAPLLITELAYPTQRDKVTWLYNTMWYVGSIVAAWTFLVAYDTAPNPTWSWQVPVLGQAMGPLLQIFLIWFVPESPRWLISKGLESKALRILARFHAFGFDERDPFVQYEMAQIQNALKMEAESNKNASFTTLFATPGNRKRMRIVLGIAFFSQWSGNGLLSHYVNLVLESIDITNTRKKATINGCLQVCYHGFNLGCNVRSLQIWNLVAAVTGALLIRKLGRRTLFVVSNAGMLTCGYFDHSSRWCAKGAVYSIFGVDPHHVPLPHEFYVNSCQRYHSIHFHILSVL